MNSKIAPYKGEVKQLRMTLDCNLNWKPCNKNIREELEIKFRKL